MGFEVAIIGLGRMGQNLALNLAEKGISVAAYNRTPDRTRELLAKAQGLPLTGFEEIPRMMLELRSPRKILLMVAPGRPVDEVLSQVERFLEQGDIVADLGNSHFRDTERREQQARARGYHFLGIGVSGGPRGARRGLSIMAGGHVEAYEQLREVLEAAAAQGPHGKAVGYFGAGGAGHFVKMVHNGIEYALMQAIAELYDLQARTMSRTCPQIAEFFSRCSKGAASSFLLEAAVEVLKQEDERTHLPLVELIADRAEQKGTGRWCVQEALELGCAVPMISAAVQARTLSSFLELRQLLSERYRPHHGRGDLPDEELEQALCFAFVMAYAEGLELLRRAARVHGYALRLAEALRVWHAGSVIRSSFVSELFKIGGELEARQHVLLSERVQAWLRGWLRAARKVASVAKEEAIPTPCLSSALDHFDTLTSRRLPAGLLQGLRDYFGGHGFERVDEPGIHHGPWE
jgi:6-phosphogluconate dehydrogenase